MAGGAGTNAGDWAGESGRGRGQGGTPHQARPALITPGS